MKPSSQRGISLAKYFRGPCQLKGRFYLKYFLESYNEINETPFDLACARSVDDDSVHYSTDTYAQIVDLFLMKGAVADKKNRHGKKQSDVIKSRINFTGKLSPAALVKNSPTLAILNTLSDVQE